MRRTLALTAAAALAAGALGAQSAGAAGSERPADRRPEGRTAVQALTDHPAAAHASAGTRFRPTATLADRDGTTHTRIDRRYRGLDVVGGDLVVHRGAEGQWQGVSQTLDTAVRVGVTPRIAADRAERRALAPAAETRDIRRQRAGGEAELVVETLSGRPRLAWAVATAGRRTDGTPSRMTTFVDARTGAVLRREEHIRTVDGTGHSLYSGTVPLQLTQSGSTYTMKDPTRGGTYTTDLANGTDSFFCQLFGAGCKTGATYSGTDAVFGNGSTSSRESAGVDAQYGTDVTWDYFKNVHGRNGIFGDGRGSYSRTHYGNDYVNAFWDGTKMTYGDGDGVEYGPLVSLDVAGHEMTHGVTENTADLTYSGESGGLNEATSDIFGTLVEFHAANVNDPGDYLIGEEFDLADHTGFRRMDNPIADGSSPNCWSSNTKNLDVHYSSGVGNHFFYLLAEGSGTKTIGGTTHSSTTCNGSTIAGIGRDAAAKIWFRALNVYMTSGTNYAGARTATLSAARDLYGAGSTQESAVAAAWSAVGVG
ncbi:M4 family metallopeptidase [Nocardioides ferulae]|uniref:M4 family metallopeptidase n=1 Tax=Nocardioides ferulae TaxID=2340821 RepID=UPI000EAD3F17|nr:M4 family metallopeptidase [Nocardioides ferulae]